MNEWKRVPGLFATHEIGEIVSGEPLIGESVSGEPFNDWRIQNARKIDDLIFYEIWWRDKTDTDGIAEELRVAKECMSENIRARDELVRQRDDESRSLARAIGALIVLWSEATDSSRCAKEITPGDYRHHISGPTRKMVEEILYP